MSNDECSAITTLIKAECVYISIISLRNYLFEILKRRYSLIQKVVNKLTQKREPIQTICLIMELSTGALVIN